MSGSTADYWYKDAIIYELHVRSFYDSNSDGMGDFPGLTAKLDYLQDLGVTAVWLLPFYPSPWRDDGYDIADYTKIHPAYGTLQNFRRFLQQAHTRGIRVITELVINHTSNQHPWFERARNAQPGSVHRDFYVWSDTPDRYREARIIFKDFESSNWSWDAEAGAYYWHRFYSHQPDLNFDNPEVRKQVLKLVDFWFKIGVDGLRLDAVPYLFERENTNCENLPETHAFLREIRTHVDRYYPDRMLLAEANQWPEDAVNYFGQGVGDECNMAFHFPLMPRLFMALKMEDRFPIIDILEQTPEIPETAQWGIFLRNHDELTLEMVTDEERDYMYQVYARDPRQRINLGIRRRLAPLLENNRRKIELMNSLLFSLPGSPVIYYGDEIGMGDNVYLGDRDGVRTPMQWSSDKNAGFSPANPQRLYLPVIIDPEYHYEALNIETQQSNSSSLLWWMKRIIATRKNFAAFSRGGIEFIASGNVHVLAFIRRYRDEAVLVLANFSRHVQLVDLDLAEYAGYLPEEVFSQNIFPRIKEDEYVLNIGGHEYYWFVLRPPAVTEQVTDADRDATATLTAHDWAVFSSRAARIVIESQGRRYLSGARWFREKGWKINSLEVRDLFPTGSAADRSFLAILEVGSSDDESVRYLLPLALAQGEYGETIQNENPEAVIARVSLDGEAAVIYDGLLNESFRSAVLEIISKRRRLKGRRGHLVGSLGRNGRKQLSPTGEVASRVIKAEQTNSSILYRDTGFLKLYRKLEEGVNPDCEVLQYLTEQRRFAYVPRFLGGIEYDRGEAESSSVGLLVEFFSNEGDAWTYTQSVLERFFESILSSNARESVPSKDALSVFAGITESAIPEAVSRHIELVYLQMVRLLGTRTGELHRAMVDPDGPPEFRPEGFSLLNQRSLYQSFRSHARRVFARLKRTTRTSSELADPIQLVLEREQEMQNCFLRIKARRIDAQKIRIHGDYHLGQVLYSGREFSIIDFEGEPARSIGERRLKHCPLRDVAGMIRSFHYAVYSRFFEHIRVREADAEVLEPWLEIWYATVAGLFLESYLKTMAGSGILPDDPGDLKLLLEVFLLEKAVYELGYELNNRPDWLMIPVKGILSVLDQIESKVRETDRGIDN